MRRKNQKIPFIRVDDIDEFLAGTSSSRKMKEIRALSEVKPENMSKPKLTKITLDEDLESRGRRVKTKPTKELNDNKKEINGQQLRDKKNLKIKKVPTQDFDSSSSEKEDDTITKESEFKPLKKKRGPKPKVNKKKQTKMMDSDSDSSVSKGKKSDSEDEMEEDDEEDTDDGARSSDNEECCNVCNNNGDVICCDCCVHSFHLKCVGLRKAPKGHWYCQDCNKK